MHTAQYHVTYTTNEDQDSSWRKNKICACETDFFAYKQNYDLWFVYVYNTNGQTGNSQYKTENNNAQNISRNCPVGT